MLTIFFKSPVFLVLALALALSSAVAFDVIISFFSIASYNESKLHIPFSIKLSGVVGSLILVVLPLYIGDLYLINFISSLIFLLQSGYVE